MRTRQLLCEIAGNPIVRLRLGLDDRRRLSWRSSKICGASFVAGVVFSVLLDSAPVGFRLSEIGLLVSVWFLVLAVIQQAAWRRHFRSGVAIQMALTRMAPREIVLGLHITRVLPTVVSTLCFFLPMLLVCQSIVRPGWTAVALFLLSLAVILEWIGRLLCLLTIQFREAGALALVVPTVFAGFLMFFGVGGILERLPDDFLLSPLATVVLIVFFWVIDAATWEPFLDRAGDQYARRVKLLLDADAKDIDVDQRRRYTGEGKSL